MKQDHGDPLGRPVLLVHPEVRASQEKPEIQAQWVNQDTEDQTDPWGNQDLMETLELQALQEIPAFLDQWGREGSQVCPGYLDSKVIRAWQVWLVPRVKLELWDSRERLGLLVRWDPQVLRVQRECRARGAELDPAGQWVNVVLKVMWASLALWVP